MPLLRGHVDRVDKFLISGWALDADDETARPIVNIVQSGEIKISLRPCFEAHTLRAALGLPEAANRPVYAFRLWMPLSNGLALGEPFTIMFADNSEPLAVGADRVLVIDEALTPEVSHDIATATLMFPSFRREAADLRLWVKTTSGADRSENLLALGKRALKALGQNDADGAVFGRKTTNYDFMVSESDFEQDGGSQLLVYPFEGSSSTLTNDRLQTIYTLSIPKTVFDKSYLRFPLPARENIVRVSGPASDQDQYLIGGLTTFNQLMFLYNLQAGKSLLQTSDIVDWGVGCGRIARHFLESYGHGLQPRLIGLDIDEINVDWCKANLDDQGIYKLLSVRGFDLESSSIDFLYGISVMTHLSEYHQHLWLSEIKRVLRPGAIAILSVHGEGTYCRQPEGIALPFVAKFGFFDGIPDSAIGDDRSDYYRATYHSRSYIKRNWGEYFDVLRFEVMANAFGQDFVVLRRPE